MLKNQGIDIPRSPDADSMWPRSLIRYDCTLAEMTGNLALDEALLAIVEADPAAACLRFWEAADFCVVLGRSNSIDTEVDVAFCKSMGIPILRRASGGGTVLVGPGCLCYTLVLPLTDGLRAMGVSRVTSEIMERMAVGLGELLPKVGVCGTSDLVWDGRKFSGNAQRWQRNAFVHHGTMLYDFDLPRMERCLNHPAREPDYRRARTHAEFVGNIPVDPESLRSTLGQLWNSVSATCPMTVIEDARKIAESRYASRDWQF